MQSKIIVILLFILSFNIMHDTVIHMIDNSKVQPISEYVDSQDTLHEFMDIHDIHSMFHFVGLSISHLPEELSLITENDFFEYLHQYTSPCLQRNNKPPIA